MMTSSPSRRLIQQTPARRHCPTQQSGLIRQTYRAIRVNADLGQGIQDLFSQCGDVNNVWIREALPVGWGDTYSDGYVEQHFDVTDLANGTY